MSEGSFKADRTVVQLEVCLLQTSLPHVMAALQVWHRRRRVNYVTGKNSTKIFIFSISFIFKSVERDVGKVCFGCGNYLDSQEDFPYRYLFVAIEH